MALYERIEGKCLINKRRAFVEFGDSNLHLASARGGVGYSQCYAGVQRYPRAVRQAPAANETEERVVARAVGVSCRNGRELFKRARERPQRGVLA